MNEKSFKVHDETDRKAMHLSYPPKLPVSQKYINLYMSTKYHEPNAYKNVELVYLIC